MKNLADISLFEKNTGHTFGKQPMSDNQRFMNSQVEVQNAPYININGKRVDLCIELYDQDEPEDVPKIALREKKDGLYTRLFQGGQMFYGEIPRGHPLCPNSDKKWFLVGQK